MRPARDGRSNLKVARENRSDILYSADLVRGRRAPAVKGRLSTEQAVALLLKGSGVGYRGAADGVFVLFELPRRDIADPGDGAISEVLVLGRRSQNAHIRRTQNDIQPYTVAGPRELAVAAQDNVDQYLRERLPANGRVFSPGQMVNNTGAPNSAIDLRGVGLQRTLVLVDGRRLPNLPTQMTRLEQSDVNAIPLGALERIETLTATAGGIHGHTRLEARLGFTPDHGRTDVMLSASYSAAERLTVLSRADAAIGANPRPARASLGQAPRLHGPASQPPAKALGAGMAGLSPWQERKVLRHVGAQLGRPISNRALAGLTGLSVGHFSRRFRASFGVGPREYVMPSRLEYAKTLVRRTRCPLCEIALASGFCDQAHMPRAFRAVLDTTPVRWRRQDVSNPAP